MLVLELGIFAFPLRRGRAPEEETPQGGRLWWTLGPALLLWGLYTGSSSHGQASADGAIWAAVVVATGAVLSVAVVERPAFWTRHPAVPGVVLVLSALGFAFGRATVDGVHGAPHLDADRTGRRAARARRMPRLGGCGAPVRLERGARTGHRDRVPGLRGAVLAYYSAYDLGMPNRWVPVVASVVVAAVSFSRAERRPEAGRQWGVLAAALASALVVTLTTSWPGTPSWRPAGGGGLRVAAYNLRMGFGMNGTMTVDRQAAALRPRRT